MTTRICFQALLLLLLVSCKAPMPQEPVHDTLYLSQQYQRQSLPEGFCYLTDSIPDVLLEIRYYSSFNFVGRRIEGYEAPVAICTSLSASALKKVSEDLREQGYLLKIFDAYRPQRAVDMFQAWASDPSDTSMKRYFYPELDKREIRPLGYLARQSAHSRGSAFDLTMVEMENGHEVDMGSPFDYFGPSSQSNCPSITPQQQENRNLLRQAMHQQGFCQNPTEWWHFRLRNEPFPNTYFDFNIQ